MRKLFALTVLVAVVTAVAAGVVSARSDAPLPPLKRQATPMAVWAEHVRALNACSWRGLMAQYPPSAEIHLPGGTVVKGRPAIGRLFAGFVKPRAQDGLCGLKFETESRYVVGGTVNVQWVATAPFLTEPYKGSDAYVTKDGLMYAMVSTFNGADLKLR